MTTKRIKIELLLFSFLSLQKQKKMIRVIDTLARILRKNEDLLEDNKKSSFISLRAYFSLRAKEDRLSCENLSNNAKTLLGKMLHPRSYDRPAKKKRWQGVWVRTDGSFLFLAVPARLNVTGGKDSAIVISPNRLQKIPWRKKEKKNADFSRKSNLR